MNSAAQQLVGDTGARHYSAEDLKEVIANIENESNPDDVRLTARVQLVLLAHEDADLFVQLQPDFYKQSVLSLYQKSLEILRGRREEVRVMLGKAGIPIDPDVF
jgi:hypothetical protein